MSGRGCGSGCRVGMPLREDSDGVLWALKLKAHYSGGLGQGQRRRHPPVAAHQIPDDVLSYSRGGTMSSKAAPSAVPTWFNLG